MKVHLVNRGAVNSGFCVRQPFEYLNRPSLCCFAQLGLLDHPSNIRESSNRLRALLHLDIELCGSDAGSLYQGGFDGVATQSERRQMLPEGFEINPEIYQCAHQHIAARSGETVEVQCAHHPRSLRNCGRISAALPSRVTSHIKEMSVCSGLTSIRRTPGCLAAIGRNDTPTPVSAATLVALSKMLSNSS